KAKRTSPYRIRPNRVTPKQIRLNVAERRAATRVSMSRLRRQKLKEFLPPHLDPPVIVRPHNLRHAINIEKLHQVSEETGVPIIYRLATILKREGGMSIDAGSGPIAGDAILPLVPGAPMMLTQKVNVPLGTYPIVILT